MFTLNELTVAVTCEALSLDFLAHVASERTKRDIVASGDVAFRDTFVSFVGYLALAHPEALNMWVTSVVGERLAFDCSRPLLRSFGWRHREMERRLAFTCNDGWLSVSLKNAPRAFIARYLARTGRFWYN